MITEASNGLRNIVSNACSSLSDAGENSFVTGIICLPVFLIQCWHYVRFVMSALSSSIRGYRGALSHSVQFHKFTNSKA